MRGSTVANIKAFATRNNVKLGSAKTKGDMQARVDEVMGARAAALESDGDDRSQS